MVMNNNKLYILSCMYYYYGKYMQGGFSLKNKKPVYKTWWFIVIVIFIVLAVIGAIIDDNEPENSDTEKPVVEDVVDDTKEEVGEVSEPTIDTSVFEYATNVEITDALSTNQHLTVKLDISADSKPGMGVQNIITQTFDFLQQDDIKDAKTITILVLQNDKKIAQYTVQKDKFVPNETDSMVDLVLQASEIEQMSEVVKQHGETLELW